MKLYLLRHGHRGNGPDQDTLTPLGLEQAHRTAQFFKNIVIEKIISGDSQRARRTTEEILKVVKIPAEFTHAVDEQRMGILQGKSGEEYKKALKESGKNENEFRPRGGENRFDAYERAKRFTESLKRESANAILVVSHAGFISDVVTLLLDMPIEESANFKTQHCAITFFELTKDLRVKDYFINDLTHLAKYYKKSESKK